MAIRFGSSSTTHDKSPRVVFCFAGLGYVPLEATRDLYRTSKTFNDSIKEYDDIIASGYADKQQKRPTIPLTDYLAEPTPRPPFRGFNADASSQNGGPTTPLATHVIQASQYALANTIKARNIQPSSVVGYSLGEFVAAIVTGSTPLSCSENFRQRRDILWESVAEPGGMLTVQTTPAQTTQILAKGGVAGDAEISGFPHPNSTILSGTAKVLDEAQEILGKASVQTQRRDMTIGMHSSHVGVVADRLRQEPEAFLTAEEAEECRVLPGIDHWSCLGVKLDTDTPLNAKYWATVIRQPIHFQQCIQGIYKEHFDDQKVTEKGKLIFLDLGMGPRLTRLIENSLKDTTEWKNGSISAVSCVEPTTMDAQKKEKEGWAMKELERKLSGLQASCGRHAVLKSNL